MARITPYSIDEYGFESFTEPTIVAIANSGGKYRNDNSHHTLAALDSLSLDDISNLAGSDTNASELRLEDLKKPSPVRSAPVTVRSLISSSSVRTGPVHGVSIRNNTQNVPSTTVQGGHTGMSNIYDSVHSILTEDVFSAPVAGDSMVQHVNFSQSAVRSYLPSEAFPIHAQHQVDSTGFQASSRLPYSENVNVRLLSKLTGSLASYDPVLEPPSIPIPQHQHEYVHANLSQGHRSLHHNPMVQNTKSTHPVAAPEPIVQQQSLSMEELMATLRPYMEHVPSERFMDAFQYAYNSLLANNSQLELQNTSTAAPKYSPANLLHENARSSHPYSSPFDGNSSDKASTEARGLQTPPLTPQFSRQTGSALPSHLFANEYSERPQSRLPFGASGKLSYSTSDFAQSSTHNVAQLFVNNSIMDPTGRPSSLATNSRQSRADEFTLPSKELQEQEDSEVQDMIQRVIRTLHSTHTNSAVSKPTAVNPMINDVSTMLQSAISNPLKKSVEPSSHYLFPSDTPPIPTTNNGDSNRERRVSFASTDTTTPTQSASPMYRLSLPPPLRLQEIRTLEKNARLLGREYIHQPSQQAAAIALENGDRPSDCNPTAAELGLSSKSPMEGEDVNTHARTAFVGSSTVSPSILDPQAQHIPTEQKRSEDKSNALDIHTSNEASSMTGIEPASAASGSVSTSIPVESLASESIGKSNAANASSTMPTPDTCSVDNPESTPSVATSLSDISLKGSPVSPTRDMFHQALFAETGSLSIFGHRSNSRTRKGANSKHAQPILYSATPSQAETLMALNEPPKRPHGFASSVSAMASTHSNSPNFFAAKPFPTDPTDPKEASVSSASYDLHRELVPEVHYPSHSSDPHASISSFSLELGFDVQRKPQPLLQGRASFTSPARTESLHTGLNIRTASPHAISKEGMIVSNQHKKLNAESSETSFPLRTGTRGIRYVPRKIGGPDSGTVETPKGKLTLTTKSIDSPSYWMVSPPSPPTPSSSSSGDVSLPSPVSVQLFPPTQISNPVSSSPKSSHCPDSPVFPYLALDTPPPANRKSEELLANSEFHRTLGGSALLNMPTVRPPDINVATREPSHHAKPSVPSAVSELSSASPLSVSPLPSLSTEASPTVSTDSALSSAPASVVPVQLIDMQKGKTKWDATAIALALQQFEYSSSESEAES